MFRGHRWADDQSYLTQGCLHCQRLRNRPAPGFVLFLDCDGVLNGHDRMPNGYCRLEPPQVQLLVSILEACPHVRVVLSSAWRYMRHDAEGVGLRGFEYLLQLAGAPYRFTHGKLVGSTESDEATARRYGLLGPDAELDYLWLKENGADLRGQQVDDWALGGRVVRYAVLDDMHFSIRPQNGVRARHFKTDPDRGLTQGTASAVIAWFKQDLDPSTWRSLISCTRCQDTGVVYDEEGEGDRLVETPCDCSAGRDGGLDVPVFMQKTGRCPKCDHEYDHVTVYRQGPHVRSECPKCQAFLGWVKKSEVEK